MEVSSGWKFILLIQDVLQLHIEVLLQLGQGGSLFLAQDVAAQGGHS